MQDPCAGDAVVVCGRVVEHFGDLVKIRFDAPGLTSTFVVDANHVHLESEQIKWSRCSRIIARAAYRDRTIPPEDGVFA